MRHANPERELNRIHVDGNQSEKALVSVPAMSTALLEKATGGDGRVDDLLVCRIQNISMKLLMSHHCALAVRQTDKKTDVRLLVRQGSSKALEPHLTSVRCVDCCPHCSELRRQTRSISITLRLRQ